MLLITVICLKYCQFKKEHVDLGLQKETLVNIRPITFCIQMRKQKVIT